MTVYKIDHRCGTATMRSARRQEVQECQVGRRTGKRRTEGILLWPGIMFPVLMSVSQPRHFTRFIIGCSFFSLHPWNFRSFTNYPCRSSWKSIYVASLVGIFHTGTRTHGCTRMPPTHAGSFFFLFFYQDDVSKITF